MIGVDYASVDGNDRPDWRAAKRDGGVGFALLRASFAMYSKTRRQWTIAPDQTYQRDFQKVPVVKGAYMFPEPRAAMRPKEQVDVFYDAVKAAGGLERGKNLPPVLDIEFPAGITNRKAMLLWMKAAHDRMMERFDVYPMLYTSARVWDGEDDDALNADTMQELVENLKNCPLWLARYPYKLRTKAVLTPPEGHPPVPAMWGKANYWIWQYFGDALQTPGFTSTVDLNKFNFSQIGEKGERVKWIQRKIGAKDDGIFGEGTQKALVAFQKKKNLSVDGTVGPATFAALAWA